MSRSFGLVLDHANDVIGGYGKPEAEWRSMKSATICSRTLRRVRRDADNLRELLDEEVLGWVTVVMLDRVEIWRVDGPAVFASQLAATSLCVTPAFFRASLGTCPKVFISTNQRPSLSSPPPIPQGDAPYGETSSKR